MVKLSVKVVFTYSLYSSEANTLAIEMRLTPGFGMNENVNVLISNSLVPAFEMPVPPDDMLPAGIGLPGMLATLPVLRIMPPVMPRVEPLVLNVPATVPDVPDEPLTSVGVPVSVMPALPAAMAAANAAALVLAVIVTVA